MKRATNGTDHKTKDERKKELIREIKALKEKKNKIEKIEELKNNKEKWQGWGDFLGTGKLSGKQRKKLNDKKIKEVLDELETNYKVYERWTDSLLRNWFDEEGLYNVKDPYIRSFFSNFTDLRKTVEGKRALIYWLKTRKFSKAYAGIVLGGQAILTQQPTIKQQGFRMRTKITPLDQEDIDAEKLLREIRGVKIAIKDQKDPKVVYTKQLLWRSCFDPKREKRELRNIRKEKLNGNKFHDSVVITFLREYDSVYRTQIPQEWMAVEKPNLMQRYVAWKMTQTNGFFNLSNQGSGKTLSAVLASLTVRSKYTLVICPNNIVNQWKDVIQKAVNGALISTGKEPHVYKQGARNYHVINYDKFSRDFSSAIIGNLNTQMYDFVIVDETQNMKVRDLRTISKRRVMIMRLLRRLNSKSPNMKKLCLTATPLINNVKEGKSLLQVITNEKFPDLGNLTTVREASKLHAYFLKYSVRYLKKYPIKEIGRNNYIKCRAEIPDGLSNEEIEKLSFLSLEQIAVKGKLKQIIKRIKGKTIIYTEWVTGITDMLEREIQKKGYRTALFTGQQSDIEKNDAIEGFIDGNIQVLIASSTIAEGFDRLQLVCSNMIFASLPFTFARYEHVIHRIIRNRQANKTVHIHILIAELGFYDKKHKWHGFEYDQKVKLNRLEFKKGMAVCVTEGRLPEKIRLPMSKIKKEILRNIIKFRHSFVMAKSQAKKLQQKGKLKWKI